ncbi:MAG: NAD(P)H-hydrate dehydratase, partial [Gammaproteobacteria bacterium]|nr:NAD(P)H-hydrate dehydratase [Gammaproteobacteria bacterium]
ILRRLTDDAVADALPARMRDAHKGDFGHILVIGGGKGMPGAALLCGEAALKSGAGRVSVATDPDHAAEIAASRPELMVHGVEGPDDIESLLAIADVIAIGPGLGRSAWATELCNRVAASSSPSVWDADALNLLADTPDQDERRVITPHPGEAGRLLGSSAATVQADRRGALAALQTQFGGVVVLKGAGTLVSSNSGSPFVCSSGNPGMAAPGMGDVLTGIIAALMGQGLRHDLAAQVGVQVHASAGDRAATRGERGMIASDVIAELRGVMNRE